MVAAGPRLPPQLVRLKLVDIWLVCAQPKRGYFIINVCRINKLLTQCSFFRDIVVERASRELYTWMSHPGTYDWGNRSVNLLPNAEQCAAWVTTHKGAPMLTLKLEKGINDWDLDYVVLQLAYTSSNNQQVGNGSGRF